MDIMDIAIPVNRKRVPWALIIGVGVTAIFFYLVMRALQEEDNLHIYVILFSFPLIYYSILSVVAFIDFLRTLFSKRATLTLTDKCLSDHLSLFSCGDVPWHEMTGVGIMTTKTFNTAFLTISLTDPEKYLTGKNYIHRHVLKGYMKRFGTPLIIAATRVDYDLQELQKMVIQKIQASAHLQ